MEPQKSLDVHQDAARQDTEQQTTGQVEKTPIITPAASAAQPEKKSGVRKGLLGLAVLILVVGGGFGAYQHFHTTKKAAPLASKHVVRIGISMDTVQALRWTKDRQYLIDDAKAQGASTTLLVANADDALQVSQIENLISQKVDVLIVIPHSSTAVAPAITKAHKAGIKVLSYDRLTLGSDVDFYVSFDNGQVGKNEAQYVVNALPTNKVANVAFIGGAPTDNNATQIQEQVLAVVNPLVAAKKVNLVYNQPTVDWQPDLAYQDFKAFLDKGNTVDGVIAANDGMASGAIRALTEKGLAGKVPVSGQDADLDAVQSIVAGTQLMTNYKSIKALSNRAIQIAIDLGNGKQPQSNATTNNTLKQVPSYLLQPIAVTKDNIKSTIVKDGFLSEKDIYGN